MKNQAMIEFHGGGGLNINLALMDLHWLKF